MGRCLLFSDLLPKFPVSGRTQKLELHLNSIHAPTLPPAKVTENFTM